MPTHSTSRWRPCTKRPAPATSSRSAACSKRACRWTPEPLARYVGTYGFEHQPDYKLTLTLEDGRLISEFPGDEPNPLEAIDAVRFRRPGSSFFELRMRVKEGTVEGAELIQANRPDPFRFLRQETAPGSAGGNASSVETGSTAEAPVEPEETSAVAENGPPAKDFLPVPKGVADRGWTGFRGTGTAGTAQGTPPLTWNVEDGTNILWKTPIPGRSHASPMAGQDFHRHGGLQRGGETVPYRCVW